MLSACLQLAGMQAMEACRTCKRKDPGDWCALLLWHVVNLYCVTKKLSCILLDLLLLFVGHGMQCLQRLGLILLATKILWHMQAVEQKDPWARLATCTDRLLRTRISAGEQEPSYFDCFG